MNNLLPVEIAITSRPSAKYINQLLKLKSGPDMLALGLFPNAKEVGESFSAYEAARKYLRIFPLNDPNVVLIAVGDGCTPRTAATFAFRSTWKCISIDPSLKKDKIKWSKINRLELINKKIEDVSTLEYENVIIAAVHSHAPMNKILEKIKAKHRALIVMPCCVKQETGKEPDLRYRDYGVWSPHNWVSVWKDV